MGMYTALVLDARTIRNTPKDVVEILKFMTAEGVDPEPENLPDHPLFGHTRWRWMLRGNSAYFPIEREPKFYKPFYGPEEGAWLLSVGCSLKNYDDEIAKFLDWLTPYTEDGVGYWMYEEDSKPTIILIGEYFEGR